MVLSPFPRPLLHYPSVAPSRRALCSSSRKLRPSRRLSSPRRRPLRSHVFAAEVCACHRLPPCRTSGRPELFPMCLYRKHQPPIRRPRPGNPSKFSLQNRNLMSDRRKWRPPLRNQRVQRLVPLNSLQKLALFQVLQQEHAVGLLPLKTSTPIGTARPPQRVITNSRTRRRRSRQAASGPLRTTRCRPLVRELRRSRAQFPLGLPLSLQSLPSRCRRCHHLCRRRCRRIRARTHLRSSCPRIRSFNFRRASLLRLCL